MRQRFARALTYVGPQIHITGLTLLAGGTVGLIAGADSKKRNANELDQDFYEFRNDEPRAVPWRPESPHHDGHALLYRKVRNAFEQNLYGSWGFSSLSPTSSRSGTASSYTVGVTRNGVDPVARFTAANLAVYLQDQWSMTPDITVVYGLRAEAPHFFTKPAHTDSVASNFGRNTEEIPSNWT